MIAQSQKAKQKKGREIKMDRETEKRVGLIIESTGGGGKAANPRTHTQIKRCAQAHTHTHTNVTWNVCEKEVDYKKMRDSRREDSP